MLFSVLLHLFQVSFVIFIGKKNVLLAVAAVKNMVEAALNEV